MNADKNGFASSVDRLSADKSGKMEEEEEVPCAESFQEIGEKIEGAQDENRAEDNTAEYLDIDLEVEDIRETQEYFPSVKNSSKSRRGRRKKSDAKIATQPSLLKSNYGSELKLGPKYRPIRPKPYQPTLPNRKIFGVASPVNVPALNSSNRIIVATPLPPKEKLKDGQLTNNLQKSKATNGGTLINKVSEIGGKSLELFQAKKELPRSARLQRKSSIELFFESMAQTVINLPMHVQAEIKMEICKIVTMAEIKYCGQTRNRYKDE